MSEMEWVMESGSSYLPLNPSSNSREAGSLPHPSYVPWTLSTEETGGKRKSNRGGMVVSSCPLVSKNTDPLSWSTGTETMLSSDVLTLAEVLVCHIWGS